MNKLIGLLLIVAFAALLWAIAVSGDFSTVTE